MERPQTRQNAPSQPDRMSPLDRVTRCVDFELATGDLEGEFVVQSVGQTGDSRSAADENYVLE